MSKSPSLRRIQADVRELTREPSDRYHAAPLDEDMFEWHFTIRGADDTDFAGGIYHGRILLPPEYPFKPPHIVFLTPSGRFETNTKVCLSFSAYHPELWQPAWGIRLILEAIISFLPTPADGAIGALDWKPEERQRLAKKSQGFCCQRCGPVASLLPKLKKGGEKKESAMRFQKEIESLLMEQKVREGDKSKNTAEAAKIEEKEEVNVATDVDTIAKEEKKQPPKIEKIAVKPKEKEQTGNVNPPAVAQKKTEETTVTETAVTQGRQSTGVQTNVTVTPREEERSWLTDPVLHGSILTFAAIVFLLYRKVESLMDELGRLEEY